MKCLAFTVTAVGDANLTVIGLVKLDSQKLDELAKLRRTAVDLDNQLRGLRKSFAYLTLWSPDIHWLIVAHDDDDADEATEKIYVKLCDSEYGVIELPEDVYDSRIRKHTELYQRAAGGGMLRTENDFIRLNEKGIHYVCEEKHCYAQHETNLVPWRMLFDEGST